VTEAEWLTCDDPDALLEFLGSRARPRKLRLFAAACFRWDWAGWTSRRERAAVVTAERMADGLAPADECEKSRAALTRRLDELDDWGDLECMPHVPLALLRPDFAWADAVACVGQVEAKVESGPDACDGCGAEARLELAALLLDIFGDPFRPAGFDRRWRTADTVGLARRIYDDRAFDRLPLLADALMDAGCDSDDILTHCRNGGPHVRGCRVVDLVLARE
jgi:hypothetical protein